MLTILLALATASNIMDYFYAINGGRLLIDTMSDVIVLLGFIYAISGVHDMDGVTLSVSIQIHWYSNS